ncbi:MAG: hypothetical protein RLZ84_647 [Actinomycetota bacterium]
MLEPPEHPERRNLVSRHRKVRRTHRALLVSQLRKVRRTHKVDWNRNPDESVPLNSGAVVWVQGSTYDKVHVVRLQRCAWSFLVHHVITAISQADGTAPS